MPPPLRPACTSSDPTFQGGHTEAWCLLHTPADTQDCTQSHGAEPGMHQLRNHAACGAHCLDSTAHCLHLEDNAGASASRSFSTGSHYSLRIDPSPRMSSDELLLKAERIVSSRLLPPLLLLVIISYLDRTALSFASIQMSQDLNLSSSIYGLGSGAFFLAYAAGQIPSNFLLLRFGGPVWLACICVAWGIAASCMAFVRGPVSFVLLRMLLGLAESGAFPGTWYYISCWYATDRTTVPYTVIETGITVSQVVAAPIAAGLLLLDGKLGLQGWQWLFMIEGLPAIMLGCFMTFWLPDSIHSAKFLSEQQKQALLKATAGASAAATSEPALQPSSSGSSSSADITVDVEPHDTGKEVEALQLLHGASKDSAAASSSCSTSPSRRTSSPLRPTSAASCLATAEMQRSSSGSLSSSSGGVAPDNRGPSCKAVVAVARNPAVLYAGCWRILHDIPGNGVLYWTPMIVQALLFGVARGAGSAQGGGGSSSPGVSVVLFSAIPYAAASLAHLVNAWHAQRVGEVKLHISCTWLLGAVALALLPFAAVGALSGSSASTSTGANIAALALLTVAHVGVNGANGLQTGLVAGCLCADQKALGLAMYNTIACMGSFLGPLLIGIIHDATHGYRVAMWVLACCLAAAAFMVYRFRGNAIHKC